MVFNRKFMKNGYSLQIKNEKSLEWCYKSKKRNYLYISC